ncbi:STAS domain-containing protein [Tundrisphaera sp. TA3]|uniref:STAS domain-containing protein n=1 Tax=Tundrisphaera sp. TA3 TaxID=3435775 RepID=UPI003EBBBEBE
MSETGASKLPEILAGHEPELLASWIAELEEAGLGRASDLRGTCGELLGQVREALDRGGLGDLQGMAWDGVRQTLAEIVRARSLKGSTPTETAMFVFSFKKTLFERLRLAYAGDAARLADELWTATTLLDRLGLWTTEVHQQTREEVILRQQQDMLELSTPVVKLWEGILALPMIGTLDSSRTQIVMESLLQKIVDTGSEVAIIDITGVPVVDTLVAQHLLKTVTAARLMGADCIISGIRPQIAQTIVHLGVDLAGVITKATLADALALAMRRSGLKVSRAADPSSA